MTTLVLSTARTPTERELVDAYVRGLEQSVAPEVRAVPRTETEFATLGRELEKHTVLLPVGVLWRPPESGGHRRAGIRDLARGINPYRPTRLQQRVLIKASPDRAVVVEGRSKVVTTLREDWAKIGHDEGDDEFARYVARRARLAVERAESTLLGPTYRTPRLVKDEVLASSRFREGLARLAESLGPEQASLDEAEKMLGELAAGWSRLISDLLPNMGRRTFERGFDPTIDLPRTDIDRLRETMARLPVIFLWSHRSNMDNPVMNLSLYDADLPLPHTFAGINMAFGPIGLVHRRAGSIFIRRGVGDNPLYKYVLKEYVGYLVERRFNLSWAIEGTRSRTGKMLPPKLGLLGHAVDAYLEGRTEDIALQPVSISFDQLHEIEEYAKYASGDTKKKENLRWVVSYIRDQGTRFFGKAYVRYPEPVSMRALLGPPDGALAQDPEKRRTAVAKMAFEVAWRINQVTPVTPTALITSILLGSNCLALTVDQAHGALQGALDHLEKVGVPLADSVAGLRTVEGVRDALDTLAAGGPVTAVRGGRETVWQIEQDNQLAATFYRNAIIHVFLNAAICEVAALAAAHAGVQGGDPVEEFWRTAYRLRDLLKFEFYFNGKDEYRRGIETEMLRLGEDWATLLGRGVETVEDLLVNRLPLTSTFTVRPFLEAYAIVYDVLEEREHLPPRKELVDEALALGRQYAAQQRISSREPVSALLFDTALKLADSQSLMTESDDRIDRTRAVHRELKDILRIIGDIELLGERAFGSPPRPAAPPVHVDETSAHAPAQAPKDSPATTSSGA